ncbi:hypothetical protein [Parageobacillus thermoglucosidasius]|uniref:Zinc ribbon domain-containing protein n=1 Tax=Parageobacillus thermoglucosidasius TaxID=1426 RepID=A0A1B7KPB9_PARTM|nr:hypothetical protein [Parageobacillus thermoglucosidasius]OAT71911.1 hypothetical protein A7K69_10910 [Parageobacillus thermoglucosidasius]
MNLEQRIIELEQRIAELEKKATAETAVPKVNLNGCTNCGRAWHENLAFCGVCGNRLIPVSELKKFYPNRNFTLSHRS